MYMYKIYACKCMSVVCTACVLPYCTHNFPLHIDLCKCKYMHSCDSYVEAMQGHTFVHTVEPLMKADTVFIRTVCSGPERLTIIMYRSASLRYGHLDNPECGHCAVHAPYSTIENLLNNADSDMCYSENLYFSVFLSPP